MNYSVAICVYKNDDPSNFSAALSSIINQSILPFDISLVCDGPIPGSIFNVIESFIISSQQKNIQFNVVYLPLNIGRGQARNISISSTKTDIVMLMDSDDISIACRAEKQLKFLIEKNVSLVCSFGEEFFDGMSNTSNTKVCPEHNSEIIKSLNLACLIINPSIMFRKKSWYNCGGYPALNYSSEDHYFFLALASKNETFYCIQEVLILIRGSSAMLRRRVGFNPFFNDIRFRIASYSSRLISFPALIIGIIFSLRRLLPAKLSYFLVKFARKFVYSFLRK